MILFGQRFPAQCTSLHKHHCAQHIIAQHISVSVQGSAGLDLNSRLNQVLLSGYGTGVASPVANICAVAACEEHGRGHVGLVWLLWGRALFWQRGRLNALRSTAPPTCRT